MKISVTQEHIQAGRALDCRRCPIALALEAADFRCVSVGLDIASCWNPAERETSWFRLPSAATDFIKNFDAGRHVEPFEFYLGQV